VADRLQLSERTLYRLLQRGELPGRKIGGQWRFRMAEIDYWLDMRVSRMPTSALRQLGAEGPPTMAPLADLIRPENALIRIPSGPPSEVIREFVAAVTYPEAVDGTELAARIHQREELSSTATGDGVELQGDLRERVREILVAKGFQVKG